MLLSTCSWSGPVRADASDRSFFITGIGVSPLYACYDDHIRQGTTYGRTATMTNMNDEWTKVVYNNEYGGFGLSDEAVARIRELKGDEDFDVSVYNNMKNRTDRDLIRVVEELGDKANSRYSKLALYDIRKGSLYRIEEYDGWEKVIEGYDDWVEA